METLSDELRHGICPAGGLLETRGIVIAGGGAGGWCWHFCIWSGLVGEVDWESGECWVGLLGVGGW